jgi:hypothetical protein
MKLEPMNFEQFRRFLNLPQHDPEPWEDELLPYALDEKSAKKEAVFLLEDCRELGLEAKVVIFRYEDGYQVDVLSDNPDFEIYEHLYKPEDVRWVMKHGEGGTVQTLEIS